MTKKKIPQKVKEVNFDDATIEIQDLPYFQVANSIVDIEGNMTVFEFAVFVVLSRYGNKGKAAFPSYNTIARKAAISRASAARALSGLLKKGYIVKKNRTGNSNVYKVIFEPVSQGDGVVSQGDGVPVSQGDSRKKDPFKKKKEEGSHSFDTLKAIEHFKTLNPDQPVTNSNIDTLTTLINKYDIETIIEALTIHVNEPDEWTKQRGSSLSTFEHNLPNYLLKVRERQEERKREELYREQNRQREEEERRHQEEKRKEEERRAALTEEQRRLEDIHRERKLKFTMLDLRLQSDRDYSDIESRLRELDQEEAELLPQDKTATG